MSRSKNVSVPLEENARPVRPAPPTGPTTGQVLMVLRRALSDATKEPWHAIVKLRPLTEETDSRFQVYVRMPSGQMEWYGEYAPDECGPEELQAIVSDIVRMRQEESTQTVSNPLDAVEMDENGEVLTDNRLAGKRRQIVLANGNTIEVKVKRSYEPETESHEQARLEREMAAFPQVMLMVEKAVDVIWNGMVYHLDGGINTVPLPIADIWTKSVTDTQRAQWRMNVGLQDNVAQAWIDAQLRGN